MQNVLFNDRGATLLWTVHKLPALTDLTIYRDGHISELRGPVSDSNGLPRCEELATLRSGSLTELDIGMLDGPLEGNTLRLNGLPRLKSCTLHGEPGMPLNVRIDGASFQGAPQLQSLRIENDEGLQLEQGSLTQLRVLTKLTLMRCGLRSVPADVACLGSTLRELDRSHNHRMQIDASAVTSVLQCSYLEDIYLYKPDIAEWGGRLGPAWLPIQQHIAVEG